jgi:hypothetical protein
MIPSGVPVLVPLSASRKLKTAFFARVSLLLLQFVVCPVPED